MIYNRLWKEVKSERGGRKGEDFLFHLKSPDSSPFLKWVCGRRESRKREEFLVPLKVTGNLLLFSGRFVVDANQEKGRSSSFRLKSPEIFSFSQVGLR